MRLRLNEYMKIKFSITPHYTKGENDGRDASIKPIAYPDKRDEQTDQVR